MTIFELALDAARDYVARGIDPHVAAFTAAGRFCPTTFAMEEWQRDIAAILSAHRPENREVFIDLTGHAGPLYLCDWDGGEFTEIHTPATLRAKYGETNLFDGSKKAWVATVYPFQISSFEQVIAHMNEEPPDGVIFRCENMTIQRIR